MEPWPSCAHGSPATVRSKRFFSPLRVAQKAQPEHERLATDRHVAHRRHYLAHGSPPPVESVAEWELLEYRKYSFRHTREVTQISAAQRVYSADHGIQRTQYRLSQPCGTRQRFSQPRRISGRDFGQLWNQEPAR